MRRVWRLSSNAWINFTIIWTRCAATRSWKRFRKCPRITAGIYWRRSNHVHAVVEAEVPPERVMSDFKAYASRRLNRMRLDGPGRKRCTRHGSTRWLWKPQHVSAALEYVVAEQGDAMSVFEFPRP
jgi:hypothetical protein